VQLLNLCEQELNSDEWALAIVVGIIDFVLAYVILSCLAANFGFYVNSQIVILSLTFLTSGILQCFEFTAEKNRANIAHNLVETTADSKADDRKQQLHVFRLKGFRLCITTIGTCTALVVAVLDLFFKHSSAP
jgi:hypothetical protein